MGCVVVCCIVHCVLIAVHCVRCGPPLSPLQADKRHCVVVLHWQYRVKSRRTTTHLHFWLFTMGVMAVCVCVCIYYLCVQWIEYIRLCICFTRGASRTWTLISGGWIWIDNIYIYIQVYTSLSILSYRQSLSIIQLPLYLYLYLSTHVWQRWLATKWNISTTQTCSTLSWT